MDPVPAPAPDPEKNRAGRLLLGMVAGNVLGGLVCWRAVALAVVAPRYAFGISLPSLLLIPFAIGLVAAWCWKPLGLRIGQTLWHSFLCTLFSLLTAVIVFREGAICIVIVSPIIYVGIAAGALTGRVWFRKDRNRLNLCLLPLFVLAILAEPAWRTPHRSVVTDSIRINAPPSKVWPHVLAFTPIPDPPRYWLFNLGLPYPVETTNGGNFVGADRSCRFTGNAVFKEKVVEFDPGRRLTFEIIEAPADPELIGHLDLHRGQFELIDNGDGTTTLIGRTWYTLQVSPAWYFDWWTHDIFSAVHLRVMRNVKRLAENT